MDKENGPTVYSVDLPSKLTFLPHDSNADFDTKK